MPVRGAIFDCDGTLLDSMPMWTETCVRLLERYDVDDAARVFAEHESLDMDKKCYWYHDNLGIGSSGEHLYRELWAMVEHEYRTNVQAFSGCAAFLEELASRGVPMVIASSTPIELLHIALEAHGLDHYFSELVFAGDVGRGKEHADVYVAACERLGTEREETWVFEDAPFGIRSAARVGFPVVALLNDHDGRDERFVTHWATHVARDYEDLRVEQLDALCPRVLHGLVVGGSPEPSSPVLLAGLAQGADYIVAADRGLDALRAAGVRPGLVCGDADSVSDEALRWACEAGCEEVRHPTEKDDTDLGLAIACVQHKAEERGAALDLTVTCVSGGRPDHWLGVWGVLARFAANAPRLCEDAFECRLLSPQGRPSWRIDAEVGTTISVVSLREGTIVSERGMQWDLDHEPLPPLSDMGVSNRIVSTPCEVCCHAGVTAVFVLK